MGKERTMAPPQEKALHAELTRYILDSAIRVQNALGVGLYEKPCKVCLALSLRQKGHQVLTDVALDIAFEGPTARCGLSPFCFQILPTVLSLTPTARAIVARLQ
jgi:hypothetical protein